MSCRVYENCQLISKQLCTIATDLNKVLSDVHATSHPLKSKSGVSKVSRSVQQNREADSDWYLKPTHHSSTAPLHPRDPPLKSNKTVSSNTYIPGTVGSIIADIRKDMEKKDLIQQSTESSGKRRQKLSCDYKPDKVFNAPRRDLDVNPEDYIDETDMDNLRTSGMGIGDKIMETVKSTLSEPNDEVVSPFYEKLAQLRMEELLLEEERLLELKRVQELIRTRRPRRHWYMLRTNDFTEELIRNTEMVRNGKYQEVIDDYRTELIKASLKTGKLFQKPIIPNENNDLSDKIKTRK